MIGKEIRCANLTPFVPVHASHFCRDELNSTEIRRLNRLPHFCRTFDWSCRIIRQKYNTDSNVEFLPGRI